MFAQAICVQLLVATLVANAAMIVPNVNVGTPKTIRNNTIIAGKFTQDTVLIHTEVIFDDPMYYYSEYEIITAFEIIDLVGGHDEEPVYYGGLNEDYLYVYPQGVNGSFLVNIYQIIENREIFRGNLNNRSSIIHTESFDSQMTYYGSEIITAFHIHALADVSVANLSFYGGVGLKYLFVVPRKEDEDDKLTNNFNITIYAELMRVPNHFVYGERTEASQTMFERSVIGQELVDNTFVVATNNWNVTTVFLTDNTMGYGGKVSSVEVRRSERVVLVHFEQHDEIDFKLEVLAEL